MSQPLKKPAASPASKPQPEKPSMIANMRILQYDGTPGGVTLAEYINVHPAAIPREFARLRVYMREGLYQVVEEGVLYSYRPEGVYITVITEGIPEPSQVAEGNEDEG